MRCARLFKKIAFHFIFFLTTLTQVQAGLSERERDYLRYRFQNIFNELDLLEKNHEGYLRDVDHQERDFHDLAVFDFIPTRLNANEIRKRISQSVADSQIKLGEIKIIRSRYSDQRVSQSIPKQIHTDSLFRLQEDQIAETITARLNAWGKRAGILRWKAAIEMRQKIPSVLIKVTKIEVLGKDHWRVEACSYRYREISFPRLSPRTPSELWPSRTIKGKVRLERQEPELAQLIKKIEDLIPESDRWYAIRQKFLLNDARLSFFISKTANLQ